MNRRNLLVLLLFSLLTLLVTWPLAAQIGDHVPGTATWSMDEYGYVWNNWWFKYAVLDRGINPFFTNYLFYPLGTSLVLYAYTLLHVMLALPVQLSFGLIPAVNSTVLFSFAIAAFGMYLFAFYLLDRLPRPGEKPGEIPESIGSETALRALAAFVAGVAFAFTSSRFVYVSLGHYNIVASEWLPFYLLFFFKTVDQASFKNAAMAGLFAAFALYTETTDGVLIALLSALILVFRWRALNRRTVLHVGLAVLSAAVFFAPLLLPTLKEMLFSGYSLPGWGHSEKLLVDLNGFFSPTSLSPFHRFWETELDQVRQGISRFSDINTFFVGYGTAALALVGLARFWRRSRLWLAVVLLFSILALGPLLHVNGQSEFNLDGLSTSVPLPFLLLHYIPLVRENRVPNRYSIVVTIGLAVLISFAAWWLLTLVWRALRARRISPRLALYSVLPVCAALSALLITEHLAIPLPLTDARIPGIYSQIGSEPGDFAVLSLPLGWRNSFGQLGAEDTRTQYYQAASGKFLLTGQIQRNPSALFDYFQRLPVIDSLIRLETYQDVPPDKLAADKAAAADLVYFFDIRYLVVNAAVNGRVPFSDTRGKTLQYARQVFPLGDKVYDENGIVAYRVLQPAPRTQFNIDFGAQAAHLYLADGWAADDTVGGASANWTTLADARTFIPLRGDPRDSSVTIRALPFDYPGHSQQLALLVNGAVAGSLEVKPGWNEYQLHIDHRLLHAGLNELDWRSAYVVRPHDAIPPNYAIGSTGVTSPVDIAVQSTPQFASIKVADKEVSPLKRGYNVVVVDSRSGAVVDARSFDTGGENAVESKSLSDFIKSVADGSIIAGAIQGEGSKVLGADAANELMALGLKDLRNTTGQTQAFIAVKGKPGGGLESTGPGSTLVSVGRNLDTRPLGVAFDWMRVDLSPGQ